MLSLAKSAAAVLMVVALIRGGFAQSPLLIHRDAEMVSQVGGTAAIMGPVRCDSSGNLYFRGFEPPSSQLPLLRLSSDGKKAATFRLEDSAKDELEVKNLAAFAVHPDGRVFYLVTDTNDQSAVIEFSKDGSYKRAMKLDRDLEPAGLAVFASGGFLISGLLVLQKDPHKYAPIVALFDDGGRFVKRVDTGENQTPKEDVSTEVRLGVVESGSDYVYILRHAQKPMVLLISASGEVLRRIQVELPKDMSVSDLRVGSGRMLIRFFASAADPGGRDRSLYSLYENLEGRKLLDYVEAPGIGGIFACFDWANTFSYIALDDAGRRTIIKGTVR